MATKPIAQVRQQILQKLYEIRKPIFTNIIPASIKQGSLVTFNYLFWKHDPYPLVLSSGKRLNGNIAGLNLHYLTFKYLKYLISQYCGKQFTYQNIRNIPFLVNAFRTYKPTGIKIPRLFDCKFLNTILGSLRSFNPTAIEAIRKEVERQLRQKLQMKADEMVNNYVDSLVVDANQQRYLNQQGSQPLVKFGEKPTFSNQPPSGE